MHGVGKHPFTDRLKVHRPNRRRGRQVRVLRTMYFLPSSYPITTRTGNPEHRKAGGRDGGGGVEV